MLSPLYIEDIVRAALKEDLGRGFDLTANLLPADTTTQVALRARKDGILCGLIMGLASFTLTDPDCMIEVFADDGDPIEAGEEIAVISGPARAILTAERTALNFVMHLSGIATLTDHYVQKVSDTNASIACTRKTTPNLRTAEKYAVQCGGGRNHRFGLDDGILIKDNHIAAFGSIQAALDAALAQAGHMMKIEIEVDTMDQVKTVLDHGGADIIMFDNFSIDDLEKAVALVDGTMLTEASGGVTLETVQDIAETGVDIISVGALTHTAPALDFGLDVRD